MRQIKNHFEYLTFNFIELLDVTHVLSFLLTSAAALLKRQKLTSYLDKIITINSEKFGKIAENEK